MSRPVRLSRVTQPFADPGGYSSRADSHGPAGHHTGIDYGLAFGARKNGRPLVSLGGMRVRATRGGVVIDAGYDSTLGYHVTIRSRDRRGDFFVHTYWHLTKRLKVRRGQRVKRNKTLGRVGNTGNSTGPHLHYQENPGLSFDYHAHRRPQFTRRRA